MSTSDLRDESGVRDRKAFTRGVDELQAGAITHALNIAVVRTQATNFSWPANRTDGNTNNPDVLMEGQRLRLDPTFDVSTLPNPAERTIAKAMQEALELMRAR